MTRSSKDIQLSERKDMISQLNTTIARRQSSCCPPLQNSLKANSFEKFERTRFLYYSKDLNMISMNHALSSQMEEADFSIT